jgi:hypothetical protein
MTPRRARWSALQKAQVRAILNNEERCARKRRLVPNPAEERPDAIVPSKSAEERRLDHAIAAHDSWARTADRADRTAPARAAMLEKFARLVDPDQTMTPEARALAAESARKAHILRMTRASLASRRAAREAGRRMPTEPIPYISEAGPATEPAAATTREVVRGPRRDKPATAPPRSA